MWYKIYSSINCPKRVCHSKYWRRSSLQRNLLNVKHHAPKKSMRSKYQIIKILRNHFQYTNCFSWIKLILVLIHLKYWYCNSPYLELLYFPHHFCQISLFFPASFDHAPLQVLDIANHIPTKPIDFNIKICKDHNILWVKHAAYQKAESLRTALSILDNTVNSNSIFNTKYAKFFTKW